MLKSVARDARGVNTSSWTDSAQTQPRCACASKRGTRSLLERTNENDGILLYCIAFRRNQISQNYDLSPKQVRYCSTGSSRRTQGSGKVRDKLTMLLVSSVARGPSRPPRGADPRHRVSQYVDAVDEDSDAS